jgi:putative IMPACT (imprinted ancient) family translation regulator
LDYALLPDLMNALKKLHIEIVKETFQDNARLIVAVRNTEVRSALLALKAALWKTTAQEAVTLPWPPALEVTLPE